ASSGVADHVERHASADFRMEPHGDLKATDLADRFPQLDLALVGLVAQKRLERGGHVGAGDRPVKPAPFPGLGSQGHHLTFDLAGVGTSLLQLLLCLTAFLTPLLLKAAEVLPA